MKVWERVVEARLRKVVEICEQQYGFMPRKSTTDAIFALRILMEKYRDGQRELHCVFVDLEKAYDRVPREELWYCMRKSGVAEKYVRVVQDMYERSRTVVRCAVGQTEEFNVEVGLHQGSALSPFLFAIVMDQLSEEARQESPWTIMFADDIVICSESREQVEENLERWRFALERRGMKVSGSKTEYMCVNEREGSGTVRLQGEEVKKVQEFKYLGSIVQSNGECGKEVKKRVQAGWNGWRKVSGVLCDQKISENISENQGEGVQDSGETGHAVWSRDSVTEEETGVRARATYEEAEKSLKRYLQENCDTTDIQSDEETEKFEKRKSRPNPVYNRTSDTEDEVKKESSAQFLDFYFQVSWTKRELIQWSPQCTSRCLFDLISCLCLTTLVENPEVGMPTHIPRYYMDQREVFGKEKAACLPAHQPGDCAIALFPNAVLPKSCVYPLSLPETKAMEDYIEEALALGHIDHRHLRRQRVSSL
ncbi:hypothetical protein QTP70_005182 [Hemibagrus guttatus]|uniref:ribonuclease H n=1 Tax=Hemibagrus guttatus TaxID=175788 RepID=A0AAE0R8U9_9TELE|nr:hypothetical protein QTP70_005182 [Hemibagrus guttatus]